MNAIFDAAKQWIERIAGCRIYRASLPHGTDCFFDIHRRFGRDRIRVAFDVGANNGKSALTYLREFPRAEIYSFEPVASTYRQLVASTQAFSRVHAYNLGLGREPGVTTINVNPDSQLSSIGLNRPGSHTESIQIDTLAGFVAKHQMESIDFLKIDTEGFDMEVLAGASPLLQQQRIHLILCECEPVVRTRNFVDLATLAEFLSRFGYEFFGVYEQQPDWGGRNELLFWNGLFVCKKLVAPGANLPNGVCTGPQ